MSPSGYEDTTVDEIKFGDLSDEDLKDIAENDSRSTAQEGAKAELNRREASGDEEDSEAKPIPQLLPDDPEERAEALGFNTDGMNFDPDFGQVQLQEFADAVEETGHYPPSGGPPDQSLTLLEVGKREQEEKEARREAMEEAAEG